MEKKRLIILTLIVCLCSPAFSSAETVLLKSGKTVDGKIIERTGKYIKLEMKDIGIPLTYFLGDIETIDGQKPILAKEETKSPFLDSKGLDSSETKRMNHEVITNPESRDEVKTIRKLPFSTAIITYKDSGAAFNGKEIAYIDAKDNKVSHDTFVEGKIGGVNKKSSKRDLCDGKTLYQIDLEEKTAPSFVVENGDAISNIFMEEMHLQYYQGQKSFLGKECKVYSSMPGEEFYFWNGILLRQKVTNHPMGNLFNITREAVDIKLNVPIPEDKFEVPSGMKVMTPKETIEDMQKMASDLKNMKREDMQKMLEDMKKDIEKFGGK